jgi:hypothetical protein
LEVRQVAETVGLVDGADWVDGVFSLVVFETLEELGCCDAVVASLAFGGLRERVV